jgi:RNA polymerase sigma factor (sigma-70 family)
VELVRAGNGEAFEVLYDRYHRQILSFCRHMLGSREEAEDAVQQSFLSAYNALLGSDHAIQLRPWLYTIARNHCLSVLRARRIPASLEEVEPAVEGLASEVQHRQDLRDTLRDLAQLPHDQRAALVLAELGALSHDEIAEVVGCPKGKVKALVFQARSSLAASRQARETPCAEIREQLANLSGGALRRTSLRRHVRECAGCREFKAEVKHQRKAMAVLLPVVPTAALKPGLMSAIAGKVGGGAGLAAAEPPPAAERPRAPPAWSPSRPTPAPSSWRSPARCWSAASAAAWPRSTRSTTVGRSPSPPRHPAASLRARGRRGAPAPAR